MKQLFGLIIVLVMNNVWAVDNPDAPDYVGDFEYRMSLMEESIHAEAETTKDYMDGYAAYEKELDKELNDAYKLVMARLKAEAKDSLRDSQRKWLKYRDAEFALHGDIYTVESAGTSRHISIGSMRTELIYTRVKALLSYLR